MMALFHIDALLVIHLLHQIIKVDDVVLHLNARNPTRQKCITSVHVEVLTTLCTIFRKIQIIGILVSNMNFLCILSPAREVGSPANPLIPGGPDNQTL